MFQIFFKKSLFVPTKKIKSKKKIFFTKIKHETTPETKYSCCVLKCNETRTQQEQC